MPIPSVTATGQPGGAPGPVMAPPQAPVQVYPSPAQDNSGFFGSFFGSKSKPKSSGPGPVKLEQPPTQLRASGSLSEREIMETEVISALCPAVALTPPALNVLCTQSCCSTRTSTL